MADRTRNWNFILYPESAPENWKDVINEHRIEWVCSPLHNMDVTADGEVKKDHYHITLLYPSHKSYEQVRELTDSLNSPIPQRCNSVKGSIRYMVHKDDPDKFQYSWSDICTYGGVRLEDLIKPSSRERLEIQLKALDYIEENNVFYFDDLVKAYKQIGNHEAVDVLMNYSTLSVTAYLKSRLAKYDAMRLN